MKLKVKSKMIVIVEVAVWEAFQAMRGSWRGRFTL